MIDKREFVAGYIVQDFDIDDGVTLIDAWEKANSIKPLLDEVRADILEIIDFTRKDTEGKDWEVQGLYRIQGMQDALLILDKRISEHFI